MTLLVVAAFAGPFGGGPFGGAQSGPRLVGQALGTPTGATQVDPSSILQAVTAEGMHLRIVLEDTTTVSDTPDEMASWSVPTRDAFGALRSVTTADGAVIRLWLGDNGLPADVICALSLTNGAMSPTTLGIGVTIQAGANGATVVGRTIGNTVNWTNTAAAAGSTSTYGAELQLSASTSATGQMTNTVRPINALGDSFTLASGSPAVASSNTVLGPFDRLNVGCGWRTGSGGSNGSVATVSADLVVVPAARVPSAARSAVQDTNRLPVTGAVPSSVTFLGLGNSHLQGAASGPIDTDFAGLAVPAGCTYRQNNGGSVTTVTTWGDRQGSVPYLCEKLLAAGVTTVKIAVNAGSGRSANGVLTNLGAAAADMYAVGGVTWRPDAILYVQSAGNIGDEAGYNAFLVDFPAVLDLLAVLYPGVPVYAASGIAASDADAGPYWDEVDAAKQSICGAHAGCTYVNIFLDPADLDGTDHPTVGHGEGVDLIAADIMAAWGF